MQNNFEKQPMGPNVGARVRKMSQSVSALKWISRIEWKTTWWILRILNKCTNTYAHTHPMKKKKTKKKKKKIMFLDEKTFNLKTFAQFLNYTNWRRTEDERDETSEQWWLLRRVACDSIAKFCVAHSTGKCERWRIAPMTVLMHSPYAYKVIMG